MRFSNTPFLNLNPSITPKFSLKVSVEEMLEKGERERGSKNSFNNKIIRLLKISNLNLKSIFKLKSTCDTIF